MLCYRISWFLLLTILSLSVPTRSLWHENGGGVQSAKRTSRSHVVKISEDTITKLALFFKVREVNLMALAGFGRPQRVLPTHRLEEAEAIWQVLTDEEKDKWIEYGELLIRGRQ